MNPLIVAAIAAAWLAGMFIGWALVHGAQRLRREEATRMAGVTAGTDDPASILPAASNLDRLLAAA